MNSRLRRPAGALLATAVATTIFGIVPSANAVAIGTISGTVTNVGGDGVPDVEVQSYVLIDGEWEFSDAEFTDSLGEYTLPLEVGDYRISFREGSHVEEFFDDVATLETATTIPVADGGDFVADAELVEYSHITGTVTNEANAPYAGVEVYARTEGGNDWADVADVATTDVSGNYVLEGLTAGTYRVEFEASTGENTGIYEVYNNKGRFDDADNIVVGSEVTVPAINAQLIAGEHDPDPFLEGVTIPMISGTPQVGQTLSVTAGTWQQGEVSATYEWFNDDGAISGATGTTYVPTATDVGKTLVVIVEASKPGFQNRFNMSNTVGPIVAAAAATPPPVVAPAPVPAPAPATVLSFSKKIDVVGALTVGSTLKLKNFKALVSRTTVIYKIQWYAGSKKIKKATKSKLKVTKALKGKKISVKVTAISGTTPKTVKFKVGKIR